MLKNNFKVYKEKKRDIISINIYITQYGLNNEYFNIKI